MKLFAAGDYEGSKQLLLQTTKVSFYLMFLLALPICLTAEWLLKLWLGVVPEDSVIFLQLVVIQSMFHVFDTSFYRALYAKGRIKENALISPTLGFIKFPIIYLLFRYGYSPVVLSWASIITNALLGLIIKPYLVVKIVGYRWSDIISVFKPCFYVTLVSLPIPILTVLLMNNYCSSVFFSFIVVFFVAIISIATATWFIGLNDGMKKMVIRFVASKIIKK